MTIPWPASRPTSYTLHLKNEKGEYQDPEIYERPIPGSGFFWEADGCARALRDGEREASLCPLGESFLFNDDSAVLLIIPI
jgi:dihydrodiol dehydrogenase / D-xylose 1-dehydrogenase (NADP)